MNANGVVEAFGVSDNSGSPAVEDWLPVRLNLFSPKVAAWGYSKALMRGLVEGNLDVLLSHGLWKYTSLASYRWHRATGRPYIVHPHGMLDRWAVRNAKWKKRLAYLAYERAHLAGAACIRALCDAEAQAIRDFGLRNKICVIPNGVDLPDLSIQQPSPWSNETERTKVLLYLGRLHPKKNTLALLEAWKTAQTVSSRGREWKLVIAGWDQNNYEAQLQRAVRALKLEESVDFAGPLFGAQKAGAFQQAEAFVLPSVSEGLPMVVLEAWAYEKPVVMTAECNLPDGFAAGAALSTGTTADAIAETVGRLFEMSEEERTGMGQRGRALVSQKFLWPRIAVEMKQVCEWVVGGGDPPACVRRD